MSGEAFFLLYVGIVRGCLQNKCRLSFGYCPYTCCYPWKNLILWLICSDVAVSDVWADNMKNYSGDKLWTKYTVWEEPSCLHTQQIAIQMKSVLWEIPHCLARIPLSRRESPLHSYPGKNSCGWIHCSTEVIQCVLRNLSDAFWSSLLIHLRW